MTLQKSLDLSTRDRCFVAPAQRILGSVKVNPRKQLTRSQLAWVTCQDPIRPYVQSSAYLRDPVVA